MISDYNNKKKDQNQCTVDKVTADMLGIHTHTHNHLTAFGPGLPG